MGRRIVIGLVLLGCSGIATPPEVKRHHYRAFDISVVDGTVTEENDFGARGGVSVKTSGGLQSVTWQRIDGTLDDAVAYAREMTFRGVARSAPSPVADDAASAVSELLVNGQRALSWEITLPDDTAMVETTWDCPKAGVRIGLLTVGPERQVPALHESALTSVACSSQPVALEAGAAAFTFTGDPALWVAEGALDDEAGAWSSRAGPSGITITSTGAFDPNTTSGTFVCATSVDEAVEALNPGFLFPPEHTRRVTLPDGCARYDEGERVSDHVPARVRVEFRRCGPGHGVSATCLSLDPAFDLESCATLFTCRQDAPASEASPSPTDPRRRRRPAAAN